MMDGNAREGDRKRFVQGAILTHVRADLTIKLPDFDPQKSAPSVHAARTSVGIEANDFGGTVGAYRYQFEGEEDLLHLIVTRLDGRALSPEEGQDVASFVLDDMPPGLVWIRPGQYSQHFYMGHDDLVAHLRRPDTSNLDV